MMLKWYFCVPAIFLTLILSQNAVKSLSNIGLVVKNLTRIETNETCEAGGNNCEYFMNLCFKFSDARNCSLFNIGPTLRWTLKPGDSAIISSSGRLTRLKYNPLRVKLETWKRQEVVLEANISRKDTNPVFIETLKLKGRLPYPVNHYSNVSDFQITECGVYFCLNVWLYMWCDNIPGCVGINKTSTFAVQTPTPSSLEMTSLYPTTTVETTIQWNSRTPIITTETHKTSIKPSKSQTGNYVTKTTYDHRRINTSTASEGLVPASTSTLSSCASSCSQVNTTTGPKDAHGDDSETVVKRWWFWLCVVVVVLLIVVVINVMVKIRYKKRTSKTIHTSVSKGKEGEVLENYSLDDKYISDHH